MNADLSYTYLYPRTNWGLVQASTPEVPHRAWMRMTAFVPGSLRPTKQPIPRIEFLTCPLLDPGLLQSINPEQVVKIIRANCDAFETVPPCHVNEDGG